MPPSRTRIASSSSSAAATASSTACADARRRRRRLVGRLADRQRLRQPQQVAGVSAPGDEPALARALERAAERLEERLVQLDVERRRAGAAARETLTSTRPRATCFCTSAAQPRSRSAASDGGRRSCRSRNRWFTARTVTPIVAALVLARQRREPGHALDHRDVGSLRRRARRRSGCRALSNSCSSYSFA